MTIICREAIKGDLDDINVLYQSAFINAPVFSKRQEIVFHRMFREEMVKLLVVEKDEYVIGYCLLALIPTLSFGGRSFAVIEHLVIDPLNRNQGNAKRLLSYACGLAKKAGCYKIISTTDSPKPWLKVFMANQGFLDNDGVFVLR